MKQITRREYFEAKKAGKWVKRTKRRYWLMGVRSFDYVNHPRLKSREFLPVP